MSYREKMLWIVLASTLAVWGWYFASFLIDLSGRSVEHALMAAKFAEAVTVLVAIQVVAAIVLSLSAGHDAGAPADDRERAYAVAACRPSYLILSTAVACVMIAAPLLIRFADEQGDVVTRGFVPVLIGNALLAALVLAEMVKTGVQLHRFRRDR